jgi:hypothetical protein
MLEKISLSILLEVKNHYQWRMTHFLRNLLGNLCPPVQKILLETNE